MTENNTAFLGTSFMWILCGGRSLSLRTLIDYFTIKKRLSIKFVILTPHLFVLFLYFFCYKGKPYGDQRTLCRFVQWNRLCFQALIDYVQHLAAQIQDYKQVSDGHGSVLVLTFQLRNCIRESISRTRMTQQIGVSLNECRWPNKYTVLEQDRFETDVDMFVGGNGGHRDTE